MNIFLALLPALAQPDTEVAEEILVYQDLFHRWDGTRWWIATEQVVPTGVYIGADDKLLSFSWQLKAVVACDLQSDRGRNRDVRCVFEDIGLQASTPQKWQRASDREAVQRILDTTRDTLMATPIDLVVGPRGEVHRVDTGEDQGLRILARQLMEPLHLRLPRTGFRDGGQWTSTEDPLLNLPEALNTRGNVLGVHYMNRYRGQQLIQSIGRARVAMLFDPPKYPIGDGKTETEKRWETLDTTPSEDAEFEVWTHTTMNSIAILSRESGFMTERVWNAEGLDGAYWHAGRLKQLAPEEAGDVGPTRQVSAPDQPLPGMPLWLPVDPEVLAEP